MSVSDSDSEICNVYYGSDFVVTSGVNAGEGAASASDSFVGDTYVFSGTATPREMLVSPDSQDDGSADHSQANSDGHDTESGSEIGTLGQGLELDSRLTFMGNDGSKVEAFIIHDSTDAHSGRGEYLLPMNPLVPGMEYTLIDANEDPGEFHYSDYTCVCFARGSMILMADGNEKLVQDIVEGDLIATKDNGPQAVRWVGGRSTPAYGHLAPIVISKGTLGNHSDLIVSPQHRILLADWRAEVMLGSHEVLVKARDLVNGDTIYRREGGTVEYYHILFDNHEIIFSEGIPSESLHINKTTLDSLAEDSRAEIIELFPEIERTPQVSAVASRMSLKSYEASALLKQVGFR